MARRLATIAKYINEHVRGISAYVESSWSSTDRRVAGTRLTRSGQGRNGTRLVVYVTSMFPMRPHWVRRYDRGILLVFDNSESYRTNDEVEEWLARWEGRTRRNWHLFGPWYSRRQVLAGEPWDR